MVPTAVIGASGFTGVELLRLIAQHDELELVHTSAETMAGRPVGELYPSLAAAYPDLVFGELDDSALADARLVFVCLPHEASLAIVPGLLAGGRQVVDLSAAFRLRDPSLYSTYYGFEHTVHELLVEAVYGLPEKYRAELVGARLVATPGCYVTAATLALEPLITAGLSDGTPLIVDAASGVSGAGRTPTLTNSFTSVDDNFTAYGLLNHRHTPEMEQEIGSAVLFTPHLAPMSRGILATCYLRPHGSVSTADVLGILRERYRDEAFVQVIDDSPQTKATLGSNNVQLTARADERTGTVVVLAALDNLTKGAAGGAIQSANVALGLPEALGLPRTGLMP